MLSITNARVTSLGINDFYEIKFIYESFKLGSSRVPKLSLSASIFLTRNSCILPVLRYNLDDAFQFPTINSDIS